MSLVTCQKSLLLTCDFTFEVCFHICFNCIVFQLARHGSCLTCTYLFTLWAHVFVCVCRRAWVYTQAIKYNLQRVCGGQKPQSLLFFHHVGSRDQIQVVSLGCKTLYLLSHPISSAVLYIIFKFWLFAYVHIYAYTYLLWHHGSQRKTCGS